MKPKPGYVYIDPSESHPGVWIGNPAPRRLMYVNLTEYEKAYQKWLSSLIRAKNVRERQLTGGETYFEAIGRAIDNGTQVLHINGEITELKP